MRELKDNGQNDVKDTGNHSKKQSSKWVAWVWGGVGLFALVFPLTAIGIIVGRLVTRFVRVPVYSFTLVVALVVAAPGHERSSRDPRVGPALQVVQAVLVALVVGRERSARDPRAPAPQCLLPWRRHAWPSSPRPRRSLVTLHPLVRAR